MKDGASAAPYASLSAAKQAGAVTLNYGLLFNAVISFFIVALAVFLIVKSANQLRRDHEVVGDKPDEPSGEEVILGEIRDLLKSQQGH